MRVIIRGLALIALLIFAFGMGIFFTTQGALGFLTGNVETRTDISLVLNRIEALSNLTTTRYSISAILTAERDLPPLIAVAYGETLTMTVVGYVNAGIDLSEIGEGDVIVEEDILILQLPPPELQDCVFNEQASRIVAERRAVFAQFPEDLQIEARRIAIDNFREQALANNILAEARLQAETAVQEFIGALVGDDYAEVRVVSRPAPPDSLLELPSSCLGTTPPPEAAPTVSPSPVRTPEE